MPDDREKWMPDFRAGVPGTPRNAIAIEAMFRSALGPSTRCKSPRDNEGRDCVASGGTFFVLWRLLFDGCESACSDSSPAVYMPFSCRDRSRRPCIRLIRCSLSGQGGQPTASGYQRMDKSCSVPGKRHRPRSRLASEPYSAKCSPLELRRLHLAWPKLPMK
jgi:hypothetical protein